MKRMLAFLGAAVLLFICIPQAKAATINAASCSQVDVQTAIDSARSGDTVQVPAGECVWSTPSYSILRDGYLPAVGINKSIILRGADIDLTNIIDATPNSYDKDLIRVNGVNGFRITGFTFKNLNNTAIQVHASKNWRIDNCRFADGDAGVVTSGDSPYGVVDSCIFDGPDRAYNRQQQ
ncbi:MAG: hypothetical protein NTY20_04465 [Candidatus Aenigmarchaeota archaeon]|nr:hypothetical protein [Candidatus Aenigmarchaeota archaeon]